MKEKKTLIKHKLGKILKISKEWKRPKKKNQDQKRKRKENKMKEKRASIENYVRQK